MPTDDIYPNWSTPINVNQLLTKEGRKKITPDQGGKVKFTGLYAFTTDAGPISNMNILYIGIARGGRQTIRARVAKYLRRMAGTGSDFSKHAGSDLLLRHFRNGDQRAGSGGGKTQMFLRWSKSGDPEAHEGSLIARFDPPYNSKDEYDYSDAEFDDE